MQRNFTTMNRWRSKNSSISVAMTTDDPPRTHAKCGYKRIICYIYSFSLLATAPCKDRLIIIWHHWWPLSEQCEDNLNYYGTVECFQSKVRVTLTKIPRNFFFQIHLKQQLLFVIYFCNELRQCFLFHKMNQITWSKRIITIPFHIAQI